MDITFKVVEAGVPPVLCKNSHSLCGFIVSFLVGFQNSIPCKEELENASYGLFKYVSINYILSNRSVEKNDKVSFVIKGDKMTLKGTGCTEPKHEKWDKRECFDEIECSLVFLTRKSKRSKCFRLLKWFPWCKRSIVTSLPLLRLVRYFFKIDN